MKEEPVFPDYTLETRQNRWGRWELTFDSSIYIHIDSLICVKVYKYPIHLEFVGLFKSDIPEVTRICQKECIRLIKYLNITVEVISDSNLVTVLYKSEDDYLEKLYNTYL